MGGWLDAGGDLGSPTGAFLALGGLLGEPRGVIGRPWEVPGELRGGPWGTPGGSLERPWAVLGPIGVKSRQTSDQVQTEPRF